MAKSKDRQMLEKLFESACENKIFDEVCDEGKKQLVELAEYLKKDAELLSDEYVYKTFFINDIYTDSFTIDKLFTYPSHSDIEVEIKVYYKNKLVHEEKSTVSDFNLEYDS